MGARGRRGIAFLVAGLALAAAAVYAGTVFDVTCGTKGCGFKAHVGMGGGRAEEQASGYCTRCAKAVSITWKRGATPPRPLARFWDPTSGAQRTLYPCPHCKEPFAALATIEEFRHCPKCKKPSLRSAQGILFD